MKHIIIANELQTNVDSLEIDENNFPEYVWNQIAPNTESNQGQSIAEGVEPLTEISQDNTEHNAISTTQSSVHARFETAANKQEIPADEYRKLLRGLNAKQRQVVMFYRDCAKKQS